CSTMGAIARHGPHHTAQKSTRTGIGDSRTSLAKDCSLTATAFPMKKPPMVTELGAAFLAMRGGSERMRRDCRGRKIGGRQRRVKSPAGRQHGPAPGARGVGGPVG